MLNYFPTPYPDEWWYSVLCRYHVRSGFEKGATTMHTLSNSHLLKYGTLYPNSTCYRILKRINSDVFSLEEILLKNTLLPYYLRFYPYEKKEKILQDFLDGKDTKTPNIQKMTPDGKQGLKFCPLCYAEDLKIHGEPYWHREHQVPLMTVCPKHKSHLRLIEVHPDRLTGSFFPLCEIPSTSDGVQLNANLTWEYPLSAAIHSALTLPFETAPPLGYNNLKNVLQRAGYKTTFYTRESSNDMKLRKCFIEFYGENIGKLYLTKPLNKIVSEVCGWKVLMPDRYVLLSVFLGLSIEELLGEEILITDSLLERLMSYKDDGHVYTKAVLAELAGISLRQFDDLVNMYDLTPFWVCSDNRQPIVRVSLKKDARRRVSAAASLSGYESLSDFAKAILLRESDRIIKENKENQDYDL